jgi:hypothetical protein
MPSRDEHAVDAGEPGAARDCRRAGVLTGDRTTPRSFNRFELKYIADVWQARRFRDDIRSMLAPDPFSPSGSYEVWSRYYDTADLRCYWEKIDGIRFRRKLRIRHYGDPREITGSMPVSVEIKQRVNRVTQKRRVVLPYGDALRLCDRRTEVEHQPCDRPVVDEVLTLAHERDLRPVAVVGYHRFALVGTGADSGLRVTFDTRLSGRDRDLDLAVDAPNRHVVSPDLTVIELKVDDRVPTWLSRRVAGHNLQLRRLSKYCQTVEAFGQAPRSAFHVPHSADDEGLVPA